MMSSPSCTAEVALPAPLNNLGHEVSWIRLCRSIPLRDQGLKMVEAPPERCRSRH